jgi:hypothetical protein
MKTYILRDSTSVEPQKSQFLQPLPPERAQAPSAAGRVLFLGLDVHNDSIAVSLAPSDITEVRRYGLIGRSHDDVLKLAKKLSAAHPQSRLQFCYEAGPHGYPLGRFLRSHGYECIIVCPSKVPRRRHLLSLGIGPEEVMKASRCRRGYWWMSGHGLVPGAWHNAWLREQGVPDLKAQWIELHYGNPNPHWYPASIHLTVTA